MTNTKHDDPAAWRILDSRVVFSNQFLTLSVDTCIVSEDSSPLDYAHLQLPDWVNVVPVTRAKELILVRQYRHGAKTVTLEVPAGTSEKGELPEDTARRELYEETGYKIDTLVSLGSNLCNPALQSNRVYSYLGFPVQAFASPSLTARERPSVVIVPSEVWLQPDYPEQIDHLFTCQALMLALKYFGVG